MNEHRVLAIIPARGGSKGVKRKNIREVGGKPLIQHTIDAAKGSTRLDRFVGSTDDAEIAGVMTSLGCEVLERPKELAGDKTPMAPVIANAIEQLAARGERFEIIVLLQPTAPFRISADIDEAVRALIESGRDTLVSVYQVDDHHPSRMYTLEEQCLVPVMAEPESRLRQDLPPVFHRNGAVYAARARYFEATGKLTSDCAVPYIMPIDRSANIDNETDLAFADFLMRRSASDAAEAD